MFHVEKYLAHITDIDKKIKMKHLLDVVQRVEQRWIPMATDFMDPHEASLARTILQKQEGVSGIFFSGHPEGERGIFVIVPSEAVEVSPRDYIGVLFAEGDFAHLSHRDFLGAIVGLGIHREKLGDIYVFEERVFAVFKKETMAFVLENLHQVGSEFLNFRPCDFEDIPKVQDEAELIRVSVSSFRLDVLISACYGLSRSESASLVSGGQVKVNWQKVEKIGHELSEGDLVSVRRYGRFSLSDVGGKTRKEKFRLTLKVYR